MSMKAICPRSKNIILFLLMETLLVLPLSSHLIKPAWAASSSAAQATLSQIQEYADYYEWTTTQAEFSDTNLIFVCQNDHFSFGITGDVSPTDDSVSYSFLSLESRKTLNPLFQNADVKNYQLQDIKKILKRYAQNGTRIYQNPEQYFQIHDEIVTRKTTYHLKPGMSGYKVYLVKKKLHDRSNIGNAKYAKYTSATKNKVKNFQKQKGLAPTGIVDLKTWLKMGFSKKQWYFADSYIYPIQVTRLSTKKDHVEALIKAAKSYLGTRYVWCAAAKTGQGIDCAGLVIQALYAAGIDPLPSGSHVYAFPEHEYTTKNFWKNPKFKHVRFSEKKTRRYPLLFRACNHIPWEWKNDRSKLQKGKSSDQYCQKKCYWCNEGISIIRRKIMQRNLLEYLENTAKRFPQKPAFCSDEEQLTFSGLMTDAKRIGSHLLKIGAYNEPILLYMKKTPAMISAMLGIIYSRCYYVPMDDEMPNERVHKIIEKTHARYLITDNAEIFSTHEINYSGNIVLLDAAKQTEIQEELLQKIREKTLDIDPLYLLFTSGSTGEPKGVIGHHRGTIDYIDAITSEMPFSERSIIGNQAPFYVDACMRDVFTTLKCGCTTWIIPKENFLFPLKTVDYLNDKKINTICWVASALSLTSSMGTFETVIPEYIRLIVSGSEVLPPKQYNLWRQALPEARIFNVYGPTETSGASTFFEIKGFLDETRPIPIGHSFQNIEVFLLDEDNELKEIGKTGEICIRGTGVTHGYFGEIARTKERFIPDPRNQSYQERIYRTGDLAEYDTKGNLLFRGRIDHQIKHMGYRIELGEIEAAAAEIVSECGCIHSALNDKIVLFYCGNVEKRELTLFLKKILPRYMIPNSIIKEDHLPHLSNGKLDRKGLSEKYQMITKKLPGSFHKN